MFYLLYNYIINRSIENMNIRMNDKYLKSTMF